MTGRQPTEALQDMLRPTLEATGVDVEAVEISTAGRRRVVRVLVDKDGGVTLDDIAAATTVVSQRLDDTDLLDDHPYTLEVTSPGIDRPLTAPRHWRRNVGRLVSVTRADGTRLTGRIREAADNAAVLEVEGKQVPVSYDDVAKARIEVEFTRHAAGGEG